MKSRVRLEWQGKSAEFEPPAGRLVELAAGSRDATLVVGDNLVALSALSATHAGAATLAYLDPPFFTGRQHARVIRHREGGRVVRELRHGFDDRWATLDDYLGALHARVSATRTLIAEEGCLVLHVDPKTSHYAKVVCDEVFGPECFASEIVWRYRRWPSKTPNFQRMHDVLLRYVKNSDVRPRFQQLYEPLAASTRATWGDRKQRAETDDTGRRRRSTRTESATPGAPLGDVWEIGILAPVARERTGYPTQKPEALLERLLCACTEPGDLVLDPYAGSGTTLAVATRLGRRALGIDENREAIDIARERLIALGCTPSELCVAPARTRRAAAG